MRARATDSPNRGTGLGSGDLPAVARLLGGDLLLGQRAWKRIDVYAVASVKRRGIRTSGETFRAFGIEAPASSACGAGVSTFLSPAVTACWKAVTNARTSG